jgi:hypothetical protein
LWRILSVIKRVPKPKGGPSLNLLYHRFDAAAFAAGGKACSPKLGRAPMTHSGAGQRALSASMTKRLDAIHSELSTPERILLFCVASGTEWERADVTKATIAMLVVRCLIERDAGARLVLTKKGRAALDALIG